MTAILKSITWRIIIILATIIISYFAELTAKQSLKVVILFNAVNLILYYLHEKAWEKVKLLEINKK